MDTKKTQHIPQKKNFINGIAFRKRIPGMDDINSFGLFHSVTGEFYIEHRGQRIFRDERGFRGKSEYFGGRIMKISVSEAARFSEVCLYFPPLKVNGVELIPYEERY